MRKVENQSLAAALSGGFYPNHRPLVLSHSRMAARFSHRLDGSLPCAKLSGILFFVTFFFFLPFVKINETFNVFPLFSLPPSLPFGASSYFEVFPLAVGFISASYPALISECNPAKLCPVWFES